MIVSSFAFVCIHFLFVHFLRDDVAADVLPDEFDPARLPSKLEGGKGQSSVLQIVENIDDGSDRELGEYFRMIST